MYLDRKYVYPQNYFYKNLLYFLKGDIESHSNSESSLDEMSKKDDPINIAFFEEEEQMKNETKISKTLSDLTTKRVISLIFSVMICIPFFQSSTWLTGSTSYDVGLRNLFKCYHEGLVFGYISFV